MKSSQVQFAKVLDKLHTDFEKYMRIRIKEAGLPITRVRFGILYHIKETGELNQQALADWHNITPQAIHRYIKDLEQKKYIKRNIDTDDTRSYRVSLTSSGKKILTQSEQIITSAVKEFYSELTTKEIEGVTNILTKITSCTPACNHTLL